MTNLNYLESDLNLDYDRINKAVHKKPHELVYADIYPWFDIKMLRKEKLLRRMALNMNDVDPLIGTYACFSYGKDQWLGKLEIIDPMGVIFNSLEKAQLDWKEKTYREICATSVEYSLYGMVSPVVVYRDSVGRYVALQGTARLRYAQNLNLKAIKAFIVATQDEYALNRNLYVKIAFEKHEHVPLNVINDLKIHPSTPLYCPTLNEKQIRYLMGPSMGDKIGAIVKDLATGTEECKNPSFS